MHLVPFGCLTKLGAKRAELVQKFVPWSRARIFRNEHTQSTPLDSKLMFHSVSYYFGAFGTVRLRYKTQFKTGQTDAKVRAMKSRGNFSQQRNRSTPLDSKVLVCIVLFGCIWDRLVALQNAVQNGPKWCKSSCHEVVTEFFATNVPDPPHWTLTSCVGAFCTIWMHLDRLVALQNSMQNGPNWCKSSCHEVMSEFFASNAPDPPYWTVTSCFGAFRTIRVHLGQFVALQHSVQNGPNWCKSSCH